MIPAVQASLASFAYWTHDGPFLTFPFVRIKLVLLKNTPPVLPLVMKALQTWIYRMDSNWWLAAFCTFAADVEV
jgi:hypothetical protein